MQGQGFEENGEGLKQYFIEIRKIIAYFRNRQTKIFGDILKKSTGRFGNSEIIKLKDESFPFGILLLTTTKHFIIFKTLPWFVHIYKLYSTRIMIIKINGKLQFSKKYL